MRLVFFIIILCSVSLYSQKRIFTVSNVQGVIYQTKEYPEKMILKMAKEFECLLHEKFDNKYDGYVRQYFIYDKSSNNGKRLWVYFIPMEKSYDFKWRYEKINYFYDDVLYTTYDYKKKEIDKIHFVNIKE